ncbi:MAG: DUF4384 domain-containing protein [Treponema sp.]|nr:DUF4384 domain-containing protein [Treponema sp.]
MILGRITVIVFAFILLSCAGTSHSSDSLTLDTAITEAASHFIQRLPQGARLALIPFNTPTGRLSDYLFEEIWSRLEDSGKFIMVDRRNMERIDAELNHQYRTGNVGDNLMVSMGRQYGAEILVHGQMSSLGNEYRMTVYATDVEKASSSQRAFNVRSDNRLSSLMNASAEDEIERAVLEMARSVNQRTTIAIGRISYRDTQTVSGFSSWLKDSIIASAQSQRDKFQIATETESSDFAVASRGLYVETPITGSPVQAVVIGSYSPLDSGAEVSVQLISTSGSRMVLASSRFVISSSELQRRRLSLLPEQVTLTQFETKQHAVDPYAGKNNRWTFTVTPDVLDGIYKDGDYMSMRIFSERDCYFRVIHVDVNGNTQIIYPRSQNDNNFIRAGQTRRIPDNTRYRMGSPFGEEFILVAAYDRPFTNNQQSGTLSADAITRGLTVEDDTRSAMSPSVTAKFSYTVLPR